MGMQEAMRAAEKKSTEDCPVKMKLVAPPLYVLTTNVSHTIIPQNFLAYRRRSSMWLECKCMTCFLTYIKLQHLLANACIELN